MKFCNSQTFPGQLKEVIAVITFGGMTRMDFLSFRDRDATK